MSCPMPTILTEECPALIRVMSFPPSALCCLVIRSFAVCQEVIRPEPIFLYKFMHLNIAILFMEVNNVQVRIRGSQAVPCSVKALCAWLAQSHLFQLMGPFGIMF